MTMHNPPHPGEFIRSVYLEPFKLSARALAEKLAVSPSTLNRIITGKSGISPEMALRLSKALVPLGRLRVTVVEPLHALERPVDELLAVWLLHIV